MKRTLALRRILVGRMRDSGALHSPRIARAFLEVPRERFLSPDLPLEEVYEDTAIVIKREGEEPISSSSQPSMMALMLEQLDVREGDRVLEIGTGSGYNAALLSKLAGERGSVVTVDIEEQLIAQARARLERYSNVRAVCADGDALDFLEPGARFDRIVVTAAASEVSPAQFGTLSPGGIVVLPLELGALQASVAFERDGERLRSRSCVAAMFMPLRGGAPHHTHRTRIGDERVFLRLAREAHVDEQALREMLSSGGRRAPGPDLPADAPQLDGLSCWLDVCEPAFCSLTAAGPAVEREAIPSVLPMQRPSGAWFGMSLSYGCRARDSLALLERVEDSLAIRVYGSDLAERALRAGIDGWLAAGRPRQEDLHIEVVFGELPSAPPGTTLSRRLRSTLSLSWRRGL